MATRRAIATFDTPTVTSASVVLSRESGTTRAGTGRRDGRRDAVATLTATASIGAEHASGRRSAACSGP